MENEYGFRRIFPKMEKFCCYLELKKGITLFTICTILSYILTLIKIELTDRDILTDIVSIDKGIFYFGVINSIITFTSLILLLIGIKAENPLLLKQFKYVFLFTYAIAVVLVIITIFKLYNSDEFIKIIQEPYEHECGRSSDNPYSVYIPSNRYCRVPSEDEIKAALQNLILFCVIGGFFGTLVNIYYYVVTCSYIEDYEESEYEKNNVKTLESNSTFF